MKFARDSGERVGFDRGYKAGKQRYHRERNEELMKTTMHPGYLFWWTIIFSAVIAGEVFGLPRWYWLVVTTVFITVELIAAYRKRPGDTFSEFVWTFLWGGKARVPVVVGLAVYLPFKLLTIAYPSVLPDWLPFTALIVGAAAWLTMHFAAFGRDG